MMFPRFSMVLRAAAVALATTLAATPASAHPHVFVKGTVDFVIEQDSLTALSISWSYDPFETLYLLSSIGIVPERDGGLSPEDKARLIERESNWPDDFDGATHLSVNSEPVNLSRPQDMQADLVDGRLVLRFRRELESAVDAMRDQIEIAFYERTFYYSFVIDEVPVIHGAADRCVATVDPFDPTKQDLSLQATLAKLSREETPDDTDVGAKFADRIDLKCE